MKNCKKVDKVANKRNLKTRFQELSKMKKILLIMFILGIGSVGAMWILSFTSSGGTGLIISGSEGVSFSQNYQMPSVDGNVATESVGYVEILNSDGNRSAQVTFETTNLDNVTDGCNPLSPVADCDVVVEYMGTTLADEDIIMIENGLSNLTTTTSCIAHSCNGEWSTNLTILGI